MKIYLFIISLFLSPYLYSKNKKKNPHLLCQEEMKGKSSLELLTSLVKEKKETCTPEIIDLNDWEDLLEEKSFTFSSPHNLNDLSLSPQELIQQFKTSSLERLHLVINPSTHLILVKGNKGNIYPIRLCEIIDTGATKRWFKGESQDGSIRAVALAHDGIEEEEFDDLKTDLTTQQKLGKKGISPRVFFINEDLSEEKNLLLAEADFYPFNLTADSIINFSVEEKVTLAQKLVSKLKIIVEMGIIPTDIKSANIVLNEKKDNPAFVDFQGLIAFDPHDGKIKVRPEGEVGTPGSPFDARKIDIQKASKERLIAAMSQSLGEVILDLFRPSSSSPTLSRNRASPEEYPFLLQKNLPPKITSTLEKIKSSTIQTLDDLIFIEDQD